MSLDYVMLAQCSSGQVSASYLKHFSLFIFYFFRFGFCVIVLKNHISSHFFLCVFKDSIFLFDISIA
jgi:hypothetical protein